MSRNRRVPFKNPLLDSHDPYDQDLAQLILEFNLDSDEFLKRRRRETESSEGSGAGSDCENVASNYICERFAKKGMCDVHKTVAMHKCQSSCNLWYEIRTFEKQNF